jgi:hypothetical protein
MNPVRETRDVATSSLTAAAPSYPASGASRGGWLARALRSRLLKAGVALTLAATLGASLSFGPIVRSKVAQVAKQRHLHIEVAAVRPRWFGARLKDVRITIDDVPELTYRADEIEVELTKGLHPEWVRLRGGVIEASGDAVELQERLSRLRTKSAEDSGGKRAPTRLELRDAGLRWKGFTGPGSDLEVTGLGVSRDGDAWNVQVSEGRASIPAGELRVTDARVEVVAAQVKSLTSERASVTLVGLVDPLPAAPGSASAPAPAPAAPATPVAPATQQRGGKRHAAAAVAGVGASPAPLLRDKLPDFAHLRALGDRVTRLIQPRLTPDATLVVNHAELSLERRRAPAPNGGAPVPDAAFAVGRGPLTLARTAAALTVTFVSEKRDNTQPLTLQVALPLDPGGDLRGHMEGGPVPLALLGLKEGALGLTDIDHATLSGFGDVVLAAEGQSLTFDGRVAVQSLGLSQPKLSREPLHGLDVSFTGRGLLSGLSNGEPVLRLDDGEVSVGALHIRARGTARESTSGLSADLGFDIPTTGCGPLLSSIPKGLLPTLQGAQMGGTFSARGRLNFVSTKLDDLVLDYNIYDDCRLTVVPESLQRARFTKAFQHRVYHADGSIGEETTGPGTPHWVFLHQMSPYMEVAVLTTEDGGFRHHKGFSHPAIKRALINNLKAGRFVQGASTISMQLAKNLFLSREKTLSRKLEELILTDYLEQTFDKDEMMELYLNIIEFGPDVYGVGRAAQHYFGRGAEELNVSEAMFLATLLPSPLKLSRLNNGGELGAGWQAHVHTLVRIAGKTGKLTEGEVSDGLGQSVVFHRTGGPRPRPRRAPRQGPDEGWTPVEAPTE